MSTTIQRRPIDAGEIRDQLRRIFASPGFFRAARMQRFLQFVVDGALEQGGHPESLKESVIGVAVFDRAADYDPQGDPVVRVEARRLRAKLEEYYEGQGKQDPIRIEIPKGAYTPVWQRQNDVAVVVPEPERHWRDRWLLPLVVTALVIAGVLAVVWGQFNFWRTGREGNRTSAGGKIRSLAILPFRNLSENSAQEYLSAGLTDEITTDLAKIRDLKVISRTSSDQYRNTKKRIPEIARELKVDAVMEGTFQSSAGHIRVSAQLIRSATDTHLWADSFLENSGDLFAIQTEIAQNIAREIGATLMPSEAEAAAGAPKPEAYDLYLRGRYLWNQRSLQALQKSIDCYQRAIALDPQYAKAYAALGDSYVILSSFGGPAPSETFAHARKAAQDALRIDPNLAEPHAVLGAIKVSYDWDWDGATREYRRALELNPGYPTAQHWYAVHLLRLQKYHQAEAAILRALELDPLSLIINADAGAVFLCARKPNQAIGYARRALELDPNFAPGHEVLGKIYEQKHRFAEAIQEFDTAYQLNSGSPALLALKGHALGLSGQRNKARAIARSLEDLSTHRYVSGTDIAAVYCGLGDHDRAMTWLGHAFQTRANGLSMIASDPVFDGCRSDPRFQEMLRKLRLAE